MCVTAHNGYRIAACGVCGRGGPRRRVWTSHHTRPWRTVDIVWATRLAERLHFRVTYGVRIARTATPPHPQNRRLDAEEENAPDARLPHPRPHDRAHVLHRGGRPVRQRRVGHPRRRHQEPHGRVHLRAERRRVSDGVEPARHERRRLEVLLRRHRQRQRLAEGRAARAQPPPAHPPRHADHHGLGPGPGLLRLRRRRRRVLRRADVALHEPVRRVQLARVVQRRAEPPVRRQGLRRQDDLRLGPRDGHDPLGRSVRAAAGERVLHHRRQRLGGRHLEADGGVGAGCSSSAPASARTGASSVRRRRSSRAAGSRVGRSRS